MAELFDDTIAEESSTSASSSDRGISTNASKTYDIFSDLFHAAMAIEWYITQAQWKVRARRAASGKGKKVTVDDMDSQLMVM